MAKQSHTNSKHIVELIESATVTAIAMLAAVDRFAFLGVINTGLPEHEARAALISALPTVKRDDIAIADEEAVRVLQLTRFRTSEMLEHAYSVLEFEQHPELASLDRSADSMTQLIWLRVKASKVFDQIETIYLTHHFHGSKRFHGFTVRDGDGRDFDWTDEISKKLHDGVADILKLDDEAKNSCDVIHFIMEDGDETAKRRLHYLVVYHPGKMRLLRQLKDRRRDLLLFTPALEATLVYDPHKNKVHVLSSQKTTARRLANLFSQIGFQKPLSKQPVDAVSYDLSRFKQRLDLKSFPLSNAIIEDAWVASLMVSLGHSAHSVTLDMKNGANVWDACVDHFGETNPISSCLSVQEIKMCYSVRFDGETQPRALDIALAQGGTCNLLAITDPRLRRCGDEILTSLGVMKRVQDIKAGANIALFRAEMKLLDLAIDDIDGHLVSALGLVAEDLVDHGLVKKKMPGHSITVPVESAEGETGYQVLQVQSNSKRSWATDKLSGREYDLHEGDLCRYGINKAFLRERIDLLLRGHLADRPVRANEQEPFVLGNYGIDDQHIPVVFVSRLWDAHHADRMDTALRQAVPGFSIILTSTAGAHHNYLGSGMVFSIDSIIREEKGAVLIDLPAIEGDVRRRQHTTGATDEPSLNKQDARNALLVGPWPAPLSLTRKDMVNVVELLVTTWLSGKRRCTKLQIEEAANVKIRSMSEFFRHLPEWKIYIRGADSKDKPRSWELNIGMPKYALARKRALPSETITPATPV